MKFMMKEEDEDVFVLLVPPHNKPLIDGKTGRVMEFTYDEAYLAQNSRTLTNELGDIIQSINALETGDDTHLNDHHRSKRRWA